MKFKTITYQKFFKILNKYLYTIKLKDRISLYNYHVIKIIDNEI